MTYYFSKTLSLSFDDAVAATVEQLKKHGFGVLTDIDVKDTMKKKLGVDVSPYRILGACNPVMAHKALEAENKIGTMLPCNVIVRQSDPDHVEVAAVDPVASMQAVGNPQLDEIAREVRDSLRAVIEGIG